VLTGRVFAAAGLAAGLVVLAGGCGGSSHAGGGTPTGSGGLAAQAAAVSGSSGAPAVRLGFMAGRADGTVLAGLQAGYFRVDLGRVKAVPFTSGAAEVAALENGGLDAAYVSPVAAVRAWQASGGGVWIVSGEASDGGRSAVVLVVTRRFLSADPVAVTGLLKAQVQSGDLIDTRRVQAVVAARTQLAALGHRVMARVLARSLARVSFTDDPLAVSVLAQARHAAASGQLRPVTSLSGLFDVAPLNLLLRAAGQRPVSS
jgi:ABC-type nitrate/sulfonate/bicarbonate transport system substrate-binding protein